MFRSLSSAIARCHPAVSPLQLLSSRCRLSITSLPPPSLPSCCRHIFTTMSPQCHHIVTTMSPNCHSLSPYCHSLSPYCHSLSPYCHPLSPQCHHNVTTMSPHCHPLSPQCHHNVTTMPPQCYPLSPHCHLTVTSRHHNVTTLPSHCHPPVAKLSCHLSGDSRGRCRENSGSGDGCRMHAVRRNDYPA